jgi:lysophospholipase L1-like esterase
MQRPSAERVIGIALAVGALALVAVLVLGFGADLFSGSRSPSPSPAGVAQASATVAPAASATPTAAPSDSPMPAPTAGATPAATLATPPLPAMLATIGDSYTQAWSVSPSYKRDHPGFSWAVGTAKGDGVFSLRERFAALGDRLTGGVVDAATSGKKMSDAARQARAVVAAAAKLAHGSTVYVTFELGINDLCDIPTTDPATFQAQLLEATGTLESGLPAGSRILMLSIPDYSHFRTITQADARARAMFNQPAYSQTCAPFLGSDTQLTMAAAQQLMATYNSILAQACAQIEANDGSAGKLHCRTDPALLSEKDFTIKDLSTVDYFHPSLSGQGKMAASAWKAGYWADVPLPSGAAALAPGGSGGAGGGGAALAGAAPAVPFLLRRRMRLRPRGPRD